MYYFILYLNPFLIQCGCSRIEVSDSGQVFGRYIRPSSHILRESVVSDYVVSKELTIPQCAPSFGVMHVVCADLLTGRRSVGHYVRPRGRLTYGSL